LFISRKYKNQNFFRKIQNLYFQL